MNENLILKGMIHNEEFARKIMPFVKDEYFVNQSSKEIYGLLTKHIEKYNSLPVEDSIREDLESAEMPEGIFDATEKALSDIFIESEMPDYAWLTDNTEKFCQERALHNSLFESVSIIDGSSKRGRGEIPKLLMDALAVSFDSHIGHDHFEDYVERYKFYTQKEDKIPFSISILNKITNGGLSRKTMTAFLGGTGTGKSLTMCSLAADNAKNGYNVLYISCEMGEKKISGRIDANLLNIDIRDLPSLKFEVYEKMIARCRKQNPGNIIVKEYPTATASVNHFRALLQELRMKENFVPDIIYIDYINICISSRLKVGASENSYNYIKSVAEEFRGLAQEYNVVLVTATQTNRSGFGDSDPGMENTSECIFVGEDLELKDGSHKKIGDVVLGDQIKSNDGYKTVMKVHHKKIKKCVKIKLKSGKTIIVSEDHEFPTANGRMSVNDGLAVGEKLNSI